MTLTARKEKRCKSCEKVFSPFNTTQQACSPQCALALVRQQKLETARKLQRAEDRQRKEQLKSRGDLTKEAQRAFNYFVRIRDHGKPCISSGRPLGWDGDGLLTGSRIDAGHYRSVGAAPHLRFNLFNCHAQSVRDNRDLSGNATDYRLGLIARIGLERVEQLEQDQRPRQHSRDDLRRIAKLFRRRARHYKKIRGLG